MVEEPGDHAASGHPPAGWYPDPAQSGRMRYWDGSAWTQHVSDAVPAAAGWQRPQRDGKFAWWQILLMIGGVLFGLMVLAFGICVALVMSSGY